QNPDAHPTGIEKGRKHVAGFDGRKGEEIRFVVSGRLHRRIGPHDNLIDAAFGDPRDSAQNSDRLAGKRAASGGQDGDALPLETARPPSRLDHRVLRPSTIVYRETDADDGEDRSANEFQVGATSEDVHEGGEDCRHRMDDAEDDLESIGARTLDATLELQSTPSTAAFLDRDDAAAPRTESPRADIHTPKSPGRPLILLPESGRCIRDPRVHPHERR